MELVMCLGVSLGGGYGVVRLKYIKAGVYNSLDSILHLFNEDCRQTFM